MKREISHAGIPEREQEQFMSDFKAEMEVKLIRAFNSKVLAYAKQHNNARRHEQSFYNTRRGSD